MNNYNKLKHLKYLIKKKNKTKDDLQQIENICNELGYKHEYEKYINQKEEERLYGKRSQPTKGLGSFLANMALYGPRINVAGGLSVEHRYIISLNKKDSTLLYYINFTNDKIVLTDKKKHATLFHYSDIDNMLNRLISNNEFLNLKKEVISYYEHLRD
jgi:hypothetical protein